MDRRLTSQSRVVVLDTSALLYWTLKPDELTELAAATTANALARNTCMVSAISIWEIALKVRQGKLDLHMPTDKFVRRVALLTGLAIVAVDVPILLRNVALPWEHRDPADRTIVATAELHAAALVTSDAAIRQFYERSVW